MPQNSLPPLLSDSLAARIRQGLPAALRVAFSEPPGAGTAAVAEALRRDAGIPAVLAVLPTPIALESFSHDALAFCSTSSCVHPCPMLDLAEDDPEAVAARLAAIRLLRRAAPPRIVVATCVQALLQPSPDPDQAAARSRTVATGDAPGMEDLVGWLADAGYVREREVYEPGRYAVKGGIVDVWPPASRLPSRLEFFGDDIESLRDFTPLDQRSVRVRSSLTIPPAVLRDAGSAWLHDALPEGAAVLWIGHEEIGLEGEVFAENAALPPANRLDAIHAALDARASIRQFFVGDPAAPDCATASLPFAPINSLAVAAAHRHDPDFMAFHRRNLVAECLQIHKDENASLRFCLDTEGILGHLRAELPDSAVDLRVARLSGGFAITSSDGRTRALYLAQPDLYGRVKRPGLHFALRPETGALDVDGEALAQTDIPETYTEAIVPGDLVVHLEYGIGRFIGLEEREMAGGRGEALCIEYARGAKLYVPVSNAHLVTRYQGVSDMPVALHSLGGRRWSADRALADAAVRTLAIQMLETQARRKQMRGFAFARETPYLHEFEASFPYTETPGQAKCIRQVKDDMMSSQPMDRLVCGDAGYGKTEVAIRAAFICAMQGRQVAVLVPTTVLAQQHYDTFRDRMAAYPITLALHSRFCTRQQRDAALEGVASGAVDIIIGTHGLLQPGIKFKDLGLVIIDEEQRFGVRHKEFLKTVRLMVDVLTLSATPIPRTLYQGIVGVRDLSLLQTPPRERVATETKVVRRTDELVKEAILAEVGRGGQVFYLHNRVLTIDHVHAHLQELLPHVRIGVGHGQMPAAQIEGVMRDFAAGRYDVLLSTTIIESGIDIPRANTILVDRADRFGIADLYQLRGRVGRAGVKAYAYFMIPSNGLIGADARERLKAIQQHTGLGSGVGLALRDLGIRGAGNLLGSEQSGHIAAVGFQLYCQLLRRAIARLRGEMPPLFVNVDLSLPFLATDPSLADGAAAASLPRVYMAEDARRLEFHRRIAECSSEAEVDALEAETIDRFGAAPEALRRLFAVARCRILAAERGISRIELDDDGVLMLFREGRACRTPSGDLPAPVGRTPDELLASISSIIRSMQTN
ncbi:MAG: transcription-repair coupling factor [Kiritimatiellia bacterium]|jgi:transcription-repair coupling factor (superfamily II helicase)